MLAAVIFKNFIANRGGVSKTHKLIDLLKDQRYENYWINLDGVFKEQIKEALLAQLAAKSAVVRTQVAYAVANIARIEIPRRDWLELIPNLCKNCEQENPDYKNAALETLGFICDELMPNDITDELKNKIIFALTTNITSNPAL